MARRQGAWFASRPVLTRASAVIVTLAAWFAIVGWLSWPGLVTGVGAALLAVAFADLDRRTARIRAFPLKRWWRPLYRLPWAVAADMVLLTTALVRMARSRGRTASAFVSVPVVSSPRQRLAVGMIAATLTPNTIAVDYDPDRGVVLLHQLQVSDDPAADLDHWLP